MTNQGGADLISVLFVILTFTGPIATAYLWWLWWGSADQRDQRSPFWLMVATFATVADILAILLVPLATARIYGQSAPPFGVAILVITVFFGLGVPHFYAIWAWVLRWRARRREP